MAEAYRHGPSEERTIYTPLSLPELFGIWKRFPESVPWAGGTALGGGNGGSGSLILPPATISLERLDELRRITRTERYLETGAMVRLREIARLGKIVPDILTRTIGGVASPHLRNLATIGGLVCASAPKPGETPVRAIDGAGGCPGAAASFIALDARFELRASETSRWISAARFYSPGQGAENPARGGRLLRPAGKRAEEPEPAERELLTRIRIPLDQWSYSLYRRFQGAGRIGALAFLARIEKNILSELRVVYASRRIIRSRGGELALAGKSLPLDRRAVNHFVDHWRGALDESDRAGGGTDGMVRAVLLNCIESCALELETAG